MGLSDTIFKEDYTTIIKARFDLIRLSGFRIHFIVKISLISIFSE